MSAPTKTLCAEVIRGLRAPAQAFERAKRKGYVWISDETGMFETIEGQIAFVPPPPANPDQLQFV
jgi:hypothetical protein